MQNPRKIHKKSAYLENLGKIGKNPRKVRVSRNLLDRIQNRVSARSALLEAADIMYLENKHTVINCNFVSGNICSASNTPALAKKKV